MLIIYQTVYNKNKKYLTLYYKCTNKFMAMMKIFVNFFWSGNFLAIGKDLYKITLNASSAMTEPYNQK